MDTRIQRDVRWLKAYSLWSSAALAVLTLSACLRPTAVPTKFGDRGATPIFEISKRRDSIGKLPAGPARDSAMKRFMDALQQPEPNFAQRVYVGRDPNKAALVLLSDKIGRPRLRLSVDSLGNASLDFLNETGKVTRSISEH